MNYPSYYGDVQPITLHDPLAEFLGAVKDGVVEISYLDCVKLAGHSCPTVAGAYLMAQEGLRYLYDGVLPQRSMIKVDIRGDKDEGVIGVTANIICYITGAGDIGGFKGMTGKYRRDGLVEYGADISSDIRLTRLDTGKSVEVSYDPSGIPADIQMKQLMQKLLQGEADSTQHQKFISMWQGRTQSILTSTDKDKIIKIKEIK